MGINLALSRITRLLLVLDNPHTRFKSIHVAGTNGKGSTVAYISSILTQAHIRNGRFTSPHLLYYNDCISINDETYPVRKFNEVSELVKTHNTTHGVGCTEFELLTVTAFKIFELEKVEFAVIEVGLGGRLDATNVLLPPEASQTGGVVACGITKIGIDHEKFLGSTLPEIATEKAGIIKPGIPCVVDGTNDDQVLQAVSQKAQECNSELYVLNGNTEELKHLRHQSPLKGNYQLQNLSVSIKLVELLIMTGLILKINPDTISKGVANVVWPGRLQTIQYKNLECLIDGAHNESAATELGTYLQGYREQEGLIFIIGLSKGKNVGNLMKYIADKSKDSIIACKFSPPDGMPWVSSYPVESIQEAAKQYYDDILPSTNDHTIEQILDIVADLRAKGDTRKVVVCGSLYLCSDVLRLVNN